MTESWTLTKLSEILQPVLRPERVDPTKEFRLLGIRLDGAGPFHRETIQGSQSAATTLYQVKSGDFIYSRLFACRGAFGIIDSNLDGCYVSGEFPTFVPINDRVDINFLRLWFRLPMTIRKVESNCTGSTPLTRNRFKENFFLNLEIFLPPLAEQRRIVANIDELAAKIEEASSLCKGAQEEVEMIIPNLWQRLFSSANGRGTQRLDEAAILERGKFSYRPRNDPRFFGGDHPWIQIGEIESSNKYIRTWTQTLNDDGLRISKKFPKGTLLISIAATIGAVGILNFDCCVPDSIVAVIPRKGMDSEFLYYYLGYLRTHLETVAPQSAQKNINLQILSGLPVPKIDFEKQRSIVSYLDGLQAQLDALKHLKAKTQKELDAMLPSILDKAFKGEL